jgi:hypothetical protein
VIASRTPTPASTAGTPIPAARHHAELDPRVLEPDELPLHPRQVIARVSEIADQDDARTDVVADQRLPGGGEPG